MSQEQEIRDRLSEIEIPDEGPAEERSWALAERAYAERPDAPRRSRGWRVLLAVAAAAILALTLLSPAGAAIRGWVSDVIAPGSGHSRPALGSLPAPGKLLVESERGPWVVQADGTQRLLGAYRAAAWSPHGIYVVATRGPRLVVLEADGDPRWALTSSQPVSQPSWQPPDGFRIAYLSGRTLRVVAGDGTGDRRLAAPVAPVAPAWRPGARHILAFVDQGGAVRMEDTDSQRLLARPELAGAHDLNWSSDGVELAAATGSQIRVVEPLAPTTRVVTTPPGPNSTAEQPVFAPGASRPAFIRSSNAGSELLLGRVRAQQVAERSLVSVPGHLTDPTWSPDGRWLVVGWREANQWLFIETGNPSKVIAVANIARQFDPGGTGRGAFPRISGWCCAP